MAIKIRDGNISTLGFLAYMTRDGIEKQGVLVNKFIPESEWKSEDGELVQLHISLVDMEGFILVINESLRVMGSVNNGEISLISSKAEGNLLEFSDIGIFVSWKYK
jgi:hypothetical protein